jgi:hypothetical protein
MDKDQLTAWATAQGWQLRDGCPSLSRSSAPNEAIVRLVFKATVVNLEVRKPSGKWERVSGAPYASIVADEEGGPPRGLGLERLPSLSGLTRENRDRQVFAKRPGPAD